MIELLILTLIVALVAILLIIIGMTGQIRIPKLAPRPRLKEPVTPVTVPVSSPPDSNQVAEPPAQPDLETLNCRVQLTKQKENNCIVDAFSIQIAGTIHAPDQMHHATVQVIIADVIDEAQNTKPVHSRVKQWQTPDSPVFCYHADLGRLPQQETLLQDWTSVAQLNLNWLIFPHKGNRNLQFVTSILSHQSREELACATCTFSYDNPQFGYIDLQENIQRAKTLAVALAFTVSAVDGKMYNCEVELIKNWARSSLDASDVSDKDRQNLEKALNKTVAFFSEDNHLDTYNICKEIVDIVPLAQRYDFLDLCLRVAQANGVASAEEMALLKNLAEWLEVDTNRFRNMVEKTLPVGMHEVKDEEVILGLSANMSKEKTRRQLNEEYNKWNARVTSSDPEIQSQADQMLKLIAEARSQYVG
jgi:tellurite resistance protein